MTHNRFFSLIALILFCTAPVLLTAQNCHAMPQAAKQNGSAIKGFVLKTMNAGGYTYMLLKTDGEDIWVAVPGTGVVSKGQEVACQPGITMTNFNSPTLNRTFASVVFSAGLVKEDSKDGYAPAPDSQKADKYPQAPQAGDYQVETSFDAALQGERTRTNINQKISDMEAKVSGGSLAAVVPAKQISVEKATGANSYTIEEAFHKRNDLNNRKVQIRGKVVKVTKNIMGKNWVHLQDGTGNPMEKNHNLVFTTQGEPELDSIVTMEGILHADKDFGAGYKYQAIIEDAIIL